MGERHFYRPADGHGLKHDPFNAIVAPRPIGWISTRSADGVDNLAPYSFFNAFNYRPPIVGFASIGWKDSVANIEATGVFGWNLASQPLAEAMNLSSATVDAAVDEFDLAGLEKTVGRTADLPIIAAAPVSFECALTQIVRLQTRAGEAVDTWVVFGEVTGVHIDMSHVVDGVFDTVSAAPMLRGGGPGDYFTISEAARHFMSRPG